MVKRAVVFFILAVLLFSFSLTIVRGEEAITLKEKRTINGVIAIELDIPAKFELSIRNNQLFTDNFEVYSLLDMVISPVGTFQIEGSTTKKIEVTIMPREKEEGRFGITYYIKGTVAGPEQAIQDTLVFEVKPFSDILKISVPAVMIREEKNLVLKIDNPEEMDFGVGTVSVESEFFDLEQEVNLGPEETQEFEITLKDLHGLSAGDYTIKFNFVLDGKELTAEREVKLVEVIKVTESEFKRTGLLSYTRDVVRKNDGNVEQYVKVELSQNFLEGIFSRYAPEADSSYYSGLNRVSVWQRKLETGETLTVKATIDYTIPVLILIIIIVAYVGTKLSKRPRLILRKKILKVKTKGGEFALKIVLVVKNIGAEIGDVKIKDRLPMAAKIHERFGAVRPSKIEKNRLEWQFEKMMPGEEHVLSYIIYSKVVLIGKINIPQASAEYTDFKGMRKTILSSKQSVVHEPDQKE